MKSALASCQCQPAQGLWPATAAVSPGPPPPPLGGKRRHVAPHCGHACWSVHALHSLFGALPAFADPQPLHNTGWGLPLAVTLLSPCARRSR